MCVFNVLARTAVKSYGRCRNRARPSEKGGVGACLGSAATTGGPLSKVRGSVALRPRLCKGIVGGAQGVRKQSTGGEICLAAPEAAGGDACAPRPLRPDESTYNGCPAS